MNRPEPLLEWHPRFRYVARSDAELVLIGEEDVVFVDDPDVILVLHAADGERNAFAIAERLSDRVDEMKTHFVLLSLEAKRVIRRRSDPAPPRAPRGSVGELAERLKRAWQRRSGRATAVEGREVGLPDHPLIILTDDYLHPGVWQECASAQIAETPRLLAGLGHRQILVGPRIIEGETACLGCVQSRLRLNLPARAWVHEVGVPRSHAVTRLDHAFSGTSYRALARGLLSYVHEAEPGVLVTRPVDDGDTGRHLFQRLPDCEYCGDPRLSTPGHEIALRSRPKASESGGGYRIRSSNQTLRHLRHLVSPLSGVIRAVEQVEVSDTDLIHVYTTNHAHNFGAPSLKVARDEMRDRAGGKGASEQDARASAVCEGLERYSAVFRPSDPVEVEGIGQLGHPVYAPNELMQFSEAQYASRVAWNDGIYGDFQWVPEPFDGSPIAWSTVRSLNDGRLFRVPSAFLYLDFSGPGDRLCRGDSNGLASGNCLEEAILQGFCELVERDSVALWWYNRVLRPRVDIASFGDPYLDSVLRYYSGEGLDLWVLDLTTDLGLPSFVAVSAASPPDRELIFGFGCHLDPLVALRRAITELNQMLPTVRRPAEERRRQLLPEFADAIEWWESARLDEHAYLSGTEVARNAGDYETPTNSDLRDDLHRCLDAAERAGSQVLVYDLTRADVDFPTVRVIVPGLRHFWRRLGPGRLYDVPVALGWLESARTESSMNPVSVFV